MKKKFFFIKKDFLVLLICCFLSVLLFFSKDVQGLKTFRAHFSNFFSFIFSPKSTALNLSLLEEENEKLIEEKGKNLSEIWELKARLRTHDELKPEWKMKALKLIPDYEYIPARILSHSFLSSANVFTVNVGLEDGIPKAYKAVISSNGDLIGKTLHVTDHKTQVHKITDKNFHVYVKHKDKNIFGQFSSIGGKYGIIESIPLTYRKSLHEGDIFITSHSSDIYPGDIPVAKIIKIDNSKTHELNIKVEILVNLDQLRNVFIIK